MFHRHVTQRVRNTTVASFFLLFLPFQYRAVQKRLSSATPIPSIPSIVPVAQGSVFDIFGLHVIDSPCLNPVTTVKYLYVTSFCVVAVVE